MPRPTRSYGRPGTKVFPTGWAATHARVAGSNLPDVCAVLRPNRPTGTPFDKTTGRYEPTSYDVVYTGPCRVEALSEGEHTRDAGDQTIATGTHDLVIGLHEGTDIRVKDLVVTSAEGLFLTLASIHHSSNTWDRRFGCVNDQSLAVTG